MGDTISEGAKEARDPRDFFKPVVLYLETQDTRLFTHPYGPEHNDAIGRIWELIPGGAGPEDSEKNWGFVKSVTPELPGAWNYRIRVLSQRPAEAGSLVIRAMIQYNKGWAKEIPDIHGVDGKEITIVVFGDSARNITR